MSRPQFVHLSVHTEYSLQDSLVRLPELLEASRERGMPAVAVTDANNMFAAVRFYAKAMKAGVKPIIGSELEVGAEDGQGRMTLLCQNPEGYRRLCKLVSRGYLAGRDSDDDAPAYDEQWLREGGCGGLIGLSGGRVGAIGQALLNGDPRTAKAIAERMKGLFGDRFYLEVSRTGHPDDDRYNQGAVDLAYALGLPVVATNGVRFLNESDYEAHEVRTAIAAGVSVLRTQVEAVARCTPHQYLKSPQEMTELFADLPEAVANTVAIAERCSVEIELGHNHLPQFPVPEGMTEDDYLETQARAGLEERLAFLYDTAAAGFGGTRKPYDERLDYELGVIRQMGFPGYFLIVSDFIQWSKDNGIPVGPGRGSGAGSLVAYALKITDLDPLRYDLLFERFLNPERVSMPDFDVDFCIDGRDRVIQHVARRYGHKAVSQIVTFGTMAARMVVRDVARALDHPYMFGDRIAKLIPEDVGITLEQALESAPDLQLLYNTDAEVRRVIDHSRKLEGLTRQVGKHAGGVLIAPGDLTDFTPLYCDANGGSVVSQYDKDDVEQAGLVKFDFLGLRNLTIIRWALDAINTDRRERGEGALEILGVDMHDPETFALLKRQDTVAVFQLESSGMRNLIRRLQPDNFEDIIALVALFRPGPLQSGMVDDFINRKKGLAEIEYPHPLLKPILENTYGVFVYQEQVMQCAQVLAGYTLGQADILRKAMGKKKPEEMEKQRSKFIDGAVANGIDKAAATRIFELMEKFAAYGFNKSHSAAYALIAYQTAWLKAHYPAEYMAAVLSSEVSHIDRLVGFIDEARNMGLQILPPSINRSGAYFVAQQGTDVLYGLEAIKGLGSKTVERILQERGANGPFRDLYDFCLRCNPSKRDLEGCIRAGAFDEWGASRASLTASFERAQKAARAERKKLGAEADGDMFGARVQADERAAFEYTEAKEWSRREILDGERATLGIFLSGHPMDECRTELGPLTDGTLAACIGISLGADSRAEGEAQQRPVRISGLVADQRVWTNKRGHRAVLTLDDGSARVDVTLYNRTYVEAAHMVRQDAVVHVEGNVRYNRRHERYEVVANKVLDLETLRAQKAQSLRLHLGPERINAQAINDLKSVLLSHDRGRTGIEIAYRKAGQRVLLALPEDYGCRVTDSLIGDLADLFDHDTVEVNYLEARTAPKRSADGVDREREQRLEEGRRTREARYRRMSELLDEAEQALAS